VDEVKPNAQVGVGIDSERFLKFFVARLSGSGSSATGSKP
jgi:hypothetical protein